ncbi:MAG TPA: glycosyltransferase family A protein [Planctomycetota bacterium]|nr:glycosyltransferase family A protein [Planctomycetota bacterium]
MSPALSIMIPTIGRASLRGILEDLVPQLEAQDQVLVVGDGRQWRAERICKKFRDTRIEYFEHGPDHAWGHPQRNVAMRRAKGTHLLSYDDDDVVLPDGLRHVRTAIEHFPDRPLVFRMQHRSELIWKDREIRMANVSTQMIVVPNVAGRLGEWGRVYEGDLEFLKSTVALYPEKEQAIVWRLERITLHGIAGEVPKRPALKRV